MWPLLVISIAGRTVAESTHPVSSVTSSPSSLGSAPLVSFAPFRSETAPSLLFALPLLDTLPWRLGLFGNNGFIGSLDVGLGGAGAWEMLLDVDPVGDLKFSPAAYSLRLSVIVRRSEPLALATRFGGPTISSLNSRTSLVGRDLDCRDLANDLRRSLLLLSDISESGRDLVWSCSAKGGVGGGMSLRGEELLKLETIPRGASSVIVAVGRQRRPCFRVRWPDRQQESMKLQAECVDTGPRRVDT